MGQSSRTTTAMLEALFDETNSAAWEEFHGRYGPIIRAVARRLGLGDDDAADVTQETLIKFLEEYRSGKFDPTRGRLRSWIIGIARFRVADVYRARARHREWRGESAIEAIPDDDQLTKIWDEECRREILRHALAELKTDTKVDPRTILAFERLCFDHKKPQEVAEEQGVSVDVVYKSKQRCLDHLRGIIERLNAEYEIDLIG